MFCDIISQQLVGLLMAASADLLGLIRRIGDFTRGMDRVTGQAVRRLKLGQWAMVFMAFKTDRDAAVFF